MKHIVKYKLFESNEKDTILDELKDNLSFITDLLGQPNINRNIYDRSQRLYSYEFKWDLKFDITHLNNIKSLEEFNKIFSELMDISSAQDRMPNFTFDVSISDKITLVAIPNSKSNSGYQFIIDQSYREVILSKSDIIRFFRDRGISVMKIEETNIDEYSKTSSIIIILSNESASLEFINKFEQEFDERDDISRTIEPSYREKSIYIDPLEEKTYITLV